MRWLACFLVVAGCAAADAPLASVPTLSSIAPQIVVPGSTLVIRGTGFTGDGSSLHVVGTAGGAPFDRTWAATLVDAGTLTVALDGSLGSVDLLGTATVTDGGTTSAPLPVSISARTQLAPSIATLQTGAIFVADAVAVTGDGFLLGGAEGTTSARITGCIARGDACEPIAPQAVPLAATSRTQATFGFGPSIAGVAPGTFTGTIALVNGSVASPPVPVVYVLVPPQVTALSPPSASLGQYVFVRGGGFAGVTELELAGTLGGTPVDVVLVPEVVSGRLARYVVDADDALGGATGHFSGTITPIVTYGDQRVVGPPLAAALDLAPTKQVVYVNLTPAFVAELADFGLRGLDGPVRDRILHVVREAYRGVNVELRTEPPADFARYTQIDLVGVDPNAEGLLGYDAGPTKDDGNQRLDDRLGGVSSSVQPDGFPGFGGVFLRSFFAFSTHPAPFGAVTLAADPAFDAIFDPLRAHPADAADVAAFAPLGTPSTCPSRDRRARVSCAVFVLGNLVGDTVAHELGHALGLANPYADGFHDAGDAPDRLMDAGGARPFRERAQLGAGPARFCAAELAYLRSILPTAEPAADLARPPCD
ncbi:MAG TPA: hypothetical protein VGM88_00560 [Kofleriaceae bacterium]|jgi:hypothetical protein